MVDTQSWQSLLDQAGGSDSSNIDTNSWESLLKDATPIEPMSVRNAKQLMAKPTENYNGLCQRFVEKAVSGTTGHEQSAISSWTNAQNKVKGTQGIKPGAIIYFDAAPSNKNEGHTGIYEGNGKFISATDNGIQENNVNDWMENNQQNLLGYIPQ